MFKLTVETDFGVVEIHDHELRELAAKHLAAMAAEVAREASGEATPATGRRRGRPPGSKNLLPSAPVQNGPTTDHSDPPARPAAGPL
jgi:hypothetical protein